MSEQAEELKVLQELGQDLILLLYGLSRSVMLYEANNATIAKQIDLLLERLGPYFSRYQEGARLQLMADEFFVNGKLLRADPRFWDRAVALAAFFQQYELGELYFDPSVEKNQCLAFVRDLGASARAQRNLLNAEGYGGLLIGEAQGQSTASYDLRPDRFAILLCGSMLDVLDWVYKHRYEPGLSLLPLRRTLQLVIDAAIKDPAMFQVVAAVRDPGRPLSWSRSRLATTIDAICFGNYLTLHRREVMCLAVASVLSGVSDSDDPIDAVSPLFLYKGIKDAAMPMALAVHDARCTAGGSSKGMAGQVLAVCETYHRLSSAGPDGPGLSPAEALERMTSGKVAGLDRGTVMTFADYKGPYPLGSAVMLSNGAPAIVVAQGEGIAGKHRPTVMLFDGEGLYGAPTDLAAGDDLWIERYAQVDEVPVNLALT
jgi:hypothetical protein